MKSTCTSSDNGKKHGQSFKKIGIKFMRSCAHKVPTVYLLRVKNEVPTVCILRVTKVHNVEKSDKNDLTIISKPHAHPHTMKKKNACKVS